MTPHRRGTSARALASTACALMAISGCADHGSPNAPDSPATSPGKPAADPGAFFAGPIDAYGQQLTQREIDERAAARAVRRIDPCGFVDPATAGHEVPGATQYGYGPNFASCRLLQDPGATRPSSDVTIYLTNYGGIYDKSAAQNTFETSGATVAESSSGQLCVETFPLHLADLPGAPKDSEVVDDLDTLFPLIVTSKKDGDPSCQQAKAVAATAARIRAAGLPLRDAQSPIPVPLLANDPCAVFPDLTGFSKYTADDADPFRCMLTADDATSPTVGVTFNSIEAHDIKQAPATSVEHRDGVTLYTGLESPGCTVYVPAGAPLSPVPIDHKAKDPEDAPLPDIEVRGPDCEQNKRVAVAAAKRFTR